MLTLIILARLVEVGVEELAWNINDAGDGAGDGRTIDVDVEHANEDRYARIEAVHERIVRGQLARRRHGGDHRHQPVGRRDDQPLPRRRGPDRIAEEGCDPAGYPEQRPPDLIDRKSTRLNSSH